MTIKNFSFLCFALTIVACGGSAVDFNGPIGTPGVFAFKTPHAITIPAVDPSFAALSTGGAPVFGIIAVSTDGKMVGGYSADTADGVQYDLYVYGSPGDAPFHLTMPNHHYIVWSINRRGEMVGTSVASGHYETLYWSLPSVAPVALATLHASTETRMMNDNGEIVGIEHPGGGLSNVVYWSSHSATPTLPTQVGGTDRVGQVSVMNDGTIYASVSTNGPWSEARWSNASVTPTTLPDDGFGSGIGYYVNQQTSDILTDWMLTSASASASVLFTAPSLAMLNVNGTENNLSSVNVIGRDRTLYGLDNPQVSGLAWHDSTSTPVSIESLFPAGTTGYTNARVTHVTGTGMVIGRTTYSFWFYAERQ